jgi:hypothetical protein
MVLTSRTFAEYRAMFALDDEDLTGVCLDCGGGAAGFVAGAAAAGARALAADPLYAAGPDALAGRLPGDLARAHAMVTSNAERRDRPAAAGAGIAAPKRWLAPFVRFSVVHMWLVARLHVDLCRVASVLCRPMSANTGQQ